MLFITSYFMTCLPVSPSLYFTNEICVSVNRKIFEGLVTPEKTHIKQPVVEISNLLTARKLVWKWLMKWKCYWGIEWVPGWWASPHGPSSQANFGLEPTFGLFRFSFIDFSVFFFFALAIFGLGPTFWALSNLVFFCFYFLFLVFLFFLSIFLCRHPGYPAKAIWNYWILSKFWQVWNSVFRVSPLVDVSTSHGWRGVT